MSTTLITPAVLQGSELAYNIFAKRVDTLRPKERITIEYRGPSYARFSFLWGVSMWSPVRTSLKFSSRNPPN